MWGGRGKALRGAMADLGLGVLVLAGVMAGAPAAAESFACPRSLRTAQEAIDVPAGMAAEEGPNDWSKLAYIEFYAGPPQPTGGGMSPTRYAVAPQSQATLPRTSTATWDFSVLRGEGVWLGCHYFSTRMYLLVPIPPGLSRCTVTWGRSDAGAMMASAVQGIECR